MPGLSENCISPRLINLVEAKWPLNNGVFDLLPLNRGKQGQARASGFGSHCHRCFSSPRFWLGWRQGKEQAHFNRGHFDSLLNIHGQMYFSSNWSFTRVVQSPCRTSESSVNHQMFECPYLLLAFSIYSLLF